ncbi:MULTISPECIES: hypothetical protein [unclassified Deinococcus]|uniref:hypothetical protein n=1 Tax=unclassified Deinococcus TaxID=2623546 RepID=UPI001C2FAEBA|nr:MULTISPECIES: hypothetical protein [unclassified Deinococcus]
MCSSLSSKGSDSGSHLWSTTLVTARAQKSDLQEGAAVGADAYLVKPFSPMELLERVGTLLDGRG